MSPKLLFCPALCALFSSGVFGAVEIKVGDINDRRTTGQFFAGLELELILSGPELLEAKAIRSKIDSATDNLGKPIPKTENAFHAGEFEELQLDRDDSDKPKDSTKIKVELANPARSATAIKALSGSVELLIPKKDPASVVSASFAKDAGKPLVHPALKAAGVEITLKASDSENDLSYTLKDPGNKVATVEFTGADGAELRISSLMSSGVASQKTVSASFDQKPPADTVIKIFLLSEKSLVTVPVTLSNIALP
jgi:hypothetical protein